MSISTLSNQHAWATPSTLLASTLHRCWGLLTKVNIQDLEFDAVEDHSCVDWLIVVYCSSVNFATSIKNLNAPNITELTAAFYTGGLPLKKAAAKQLPSL